MFLLNQNVPNYTIFFMVAGSKINNRFEWVDISKGIVILLMVIGHTNLPEFANRWIWSFHMPFFFFISGFLSGFSRPVIEFARHKTKQLIYPFVSYSLIVVVLWALAQRISPLDLLINVMQNGWGGIALWFVPVLYFSTIIVRLIPEKCLWISIVILILIASVLSSEKIELPWTLTSVPYASAMVAIGRVLKKWGKTIIEDNLNNSWTNVIICICGILGGLLISKYYRLDMACNQVKPVFQITIGALLGIVSMISFAIIISQLHLSIVKVFKWCGKNTYEIMALSQVIIILLNSYMEINPIFKYTIMACMIYMAVMIRQKISNKPLPKDPI